MQRILRWFMLAGLALAACSPPAPVPTATSAPAAQATAPTVAQAPTQPAIQPTAPAGGAAAEASTLAPGAEPPTTVPSTEAPTQAPTPFVISDEFTPSDPETVNLAAGKPQLVEFFAFW